MLKYPVQRNGKDRVNTEMPTEMIKEKDYVPGLVMQQKNLKNISIELPLLRRCLYRDDW
jgi:hypothetical protein